MNKILRDTFGHIERVAENANTSTFCWQKVMVKIKGLIRIALVDKKWVVSFYFFVIFKKWPKVSRLNFSFMFSHFFQAGIARKNVRKSKGIVYVIYFRLFISFFLKNRPKTAKKLKLTLPLG